MGSMFTKNSPGLVAWGNQGAERRKSHKTHGQQPGEPSSDTTQATVNTHQVEVHVCPSTQNKNEAHMVVLPDMMELQKTFPDGTETQSSESARVVSEVLVVEPAAKVVDSTGDVMVGTEVQPTGLDLQCEDEASSETCEIPVAGHDCGGSSDGIKDASSPESPLHSSVVLEEEIPLEATPVVQEGASQQATEDLHPPPNASGEDEPFTHDQKASCEKEVELDPETSVGAAEQNTIAQRQVNDMSSGETEADGKSSS